MDAKRPLMLGVVGDSATGKTTLTRGVGRLLGAAGVTPLCLDDYHRYDRAERQARGLTALDPAANNLDLMAEHLATLRAGGMISKPVYDHRTGRIRGPELVAATGLVIAYGLLTLTPPSLAELFDLTIYLDPDEELRRRWRLERDVAQRGYSAAEVLARQAAHDRDAVRFVHGQRRRADLVLRFATDGSTTLFARPVPSTRPLADLLAFAGPNRSGFGVRGGIRDDDGHLSDLLVIAGDLPTETCAALQAWLSERLPGAPSNFDRLGTLDSGPHPARSESLALLQLLIAYLLVNRRHDPR